MRGEDGGTKDATWKAAEEGSGEIDRWKERMDGRINGRRACTPEEYLGVVERIKLRSMITEVLGLPIERNISAGQRDVGR